MFPLIAAEICSVKQEAECGAAQTSEQTRGRTYVSGVFYTKLICFLGISRKQKVSQRYAATSRSLLLLSEQEYIDQRVTYLIR